MANTRSVFFALIFLGLLLTVGCGGGSGSGNSGGGGGSLSLSLSSSSSLLFPSSSTESITATLTRTGTTGNVQLTVSGLPPGAEVTVQSPGNGTNGSITLGAGSAPAGNYSAMVVASDGTATGMAALSVSIGASVRVNAAVTGRLQLAMSTSFQPAEWNYQLFTSLPSALPPLADLEAQHIRLQPISRGIPQKTADTWDFTTVDAITQPVLGVGDHSPEYQIAVGPPFLYDSSHNFVDPSYGQFATYAQQLVHYYNTGGFTDSGGNFHKSPGSYPITWWGVYNEPNYNNLNPTQYTQLYNVTVPEMQAADPTLKFAAIELGGGGNWEQLYLPTFVNSVTAQVDVLATHYYSTCNQHDTDAQLFSTIPGFATQVRYIRSQLATVPKLANVPVWITENNVNADFEGANGMSTCNPNQQFVRDVRGSSAFFAAWRPLMFSQVGKAGAQALYHWEYAADAQYGELDDTTGGTRLSYWVDYWLTRMFPAPPGADILDFSSSDTSDLEVLAVRNNDNSVVLMIANYALASAIDNNGPGVPRSVSLDISSVGTFTSASLLTIDGTTDPANGPTPATLAPTSPVQVTLKGYGVAFVKLQ